MAEQRLVADLALAKATSGIIMRSERQADLRLLEDTFVDSGVVAQILNRNSQILYGRRGTGKSHVLRILAARTDVSRGELALYVDLRTLGSAQLVTDPARSVTTRSVGVFRDLLSLLQHSLLDCSIKMDGRGLEAVSTFADSIQSVTSVVKERETTDEWQRAQVAESGGGMNLALTNPTLSVQASDRSEVVSKKTGRYNEIFEDTVVFAEVAHDLDAALRALEIEHFVLLIDEWPAIPVDIQPYFAEFIKRTVLPSSRITVKIASLEYSSKFSERLADGTRIGFELGGDIFANLDLDDFYTPDRNSPRAVNFFKELLYRHLAAELPEHHLARTHGLETSEDLVFGLFGCLSAFEELVRASEGVVRDFLGIYTSAFFHAMRDGADSVDSAAVATASLNWFEVDKLPNLEQGLYAVYQQLVNEVLGTSRLPYFLLERNHASHPTVRALYDLRLIHLVKRGLTRPARLGTRYHLYALDHGTYADLDVAAEEASAPDALAGEVIVLTPEALEP